MQETRVLLLEEMVAWCIEKRFGMAGLYRFFVSVCAVIVEGGVCKTKKKQIPPLRCGMTTKERASATATATATANANATGTANAGVLRFAQNDRL
jgi:hypothetical protein